MKNNLSNVFLFLVLFNSNRIEVIIEVCCASLKSVENAALAGAHRVELCSGLELGGITPSKGLLEEAVGLNLIDVHCLIRPRAGHFFYSAEEKKIIEKDIQTALEIGCKGVVIGGLTADFQLDLSALKYWKQLAGDMYLTFHRAFDVVVNPVEALQQLIALGFDCVLSSGQQEKAMEGFEKLESWNSQFGREILIMPGSGINGSNCERFGFAGFNAIHFSGAAPKPKLKVPAGVNSKISFLNQEISESDVEKIRAVVQRLNAN